MEIKTFFIAIVLIVALGVGGWLLYQKGFFSVAEIPGGSSPVLGKVFTTFRNGEIQECKYHGAKVLAVAINAYDAGSDILNYNDGSTVGTCNYAWGAPSEACGQISECTTIYRVSPNIWGKPGVDMYNLREKYPQPVQ